jgi:hypothetical protein
MPDGRRGRVWLGVGGKCINGKWQGGSERIVGDDRHWRVSLHEAAKVDEEARRVVPRAATLRAVWATELPEPLRGIRVRLFLEDEAPTLGSGQRLIVCQLRGKKVILHHASYSATIKRDAFKALVAANKRYRRRNAWSVGTLRPSGSWSTTRSL